MDINNRIMKINKKLQRNQLFCQMFSIREAISNDTRKDELRDEKCY